MRGGSRGLSSLPPACPNTHLAGMAVQSHACRELSGCLQAASRPGQGLPELQRGVALLARPPAAPAAIIRAAAVTGAVATGQGHFMLASPLLLPNSAAHARASGHTAAAGRPILTNPHNARHQHGSSSAHSSAHCLIGEGRGGQAARMKDEDGQDQGDQDAQSDILGGAEATQAFRDKARSGLCAAVAPAGKNSWRKTASLCPQVASDDRLQAAHAVFSLKEATLKVGLGPAAAAAAAPGPGQLRHRPAPAPAPRHHRAPAPAPAHAPPAG